MNNFESIALTESAFYARHKRWWDQSIQSIPHALSVELLLLEFHQEGKLPQSKMQLPF